MTLSTILKRLTARPTDAEPRYSHDPLRLATAAVLLDIAYADENFSASEGEDISTFLVRQFELSPEDTEELMKAAAELRAQTIDHFAMSNYVRLNMSLEQRIEVVKTMWRMAYGDGKLTEMEAYLVRKISGLLGLEHHVMIDAKTAVLRELGKATD